MLIVDDFFLVSTLGHDLVAAQRQVSVSDVLVLLLLEQKEVRGAGVPGRE